MILYITLQREMDLNLSKELALSSFGIRVRKVELNACKILFVDIESSTTFKMFVLTIAQ
jgi:hypothetical protein